MTAAALLCGAQVRSRPEPRAEVKPVKPVKLVKDQSGASSA
jgi:hypothetical protein